MGIEEVIFDVDGSENLTVDFWGGFEGELVDLIGELVEVELGLFDMLDLKIGFAFKGVFQADSDSTGDFGFTGSSARFSVNFGVLEGFFDNFDNFG